MKSKLKVKNDFIFQRIFGRKENKDILLSLLNAILQLDADNRLEDIEILENTKLEKDRIEDKQGILDVRAKTMTGEQVNIEIQLVNQYNMDKRTLFYWSKMYTSQLNAGQRFNDLKKTITINIVDFNFIELDNYHTSYHLREDNDVEYVLTDIIEIHFIELPKFRKKHDLDINNALERWLAFFEQPSEEVLDMLKNQDPAIGKAEKVLNWLSSDEETVRLYEMREMAIHDEVSRIEGAKEEGIQKGLEQGLKQGKKEIIKNMLLNNMEVDVISKVTGVTVEFVNKVKKNIQH